MSFGHNFTNSHTLSAGTSFCNELHRLSQTATIGPTFLHNASHSLMPFPTAARATFSHKSHSVAILAQVILAQVLSSHLNQGSFKVFSNLSRKAMKAFSVAAVAVLVTKAAADSGSCPTPHGDQTSCDADGACTWCKCGALPSACWTKSDAHKLPAAVYTCDGLAFEAAAPPLNGSSPDGLECDLCEKVARAAVGKGIKECDALCKKVGPIVAVCESLCSSLQKDVPADKVCELVKLCPKDIVV